MDDLEGIVARDAAVEDYMIAGDRSIPYKRVCLDRRALLVERQRLWDLALKRWENNQRLEGYAERLEAAEELLNRNFPFPYDPVTYGPFYEQWTKDRLAWLASAPITKGNENG